MRNSLSRARAGDLRGAIALAEEALATGKDQAALLALAGMLSCQAGDLATGIDHLAKALAQRPDDLATRANLVQALFEADRHDEADAFLDVDHVAADPTGRLSRLHAQSLQRRGDDHAAIEAYRLAVARAPNDFESWNNLGNLHAALGEAEYGLEALRRAAELRPDLLEIRLNLAMAIAETGQEEAAAAEFAACAAEFPDDPRPLGELGSLLGRLHRDEEALDVLNRAVALAPDDPYLHVRLGEQLVATFDNAGGEKAFRTALDHDPAHGDAAIQLAILYDQTNRIPDLDALLKSAERASIEPSALEFIRALVLRRQGRFAEALAAIEQVPEMIEPGRRSQLFGQFHDRLGHVDEAFAAFTEMNRLNALDPTRPRERAAGLRARIAADRQVVTPEWYAGWLTSAQPDADRPAPVFLVGFPRSGTTLLDTMLLGHPGVTVMEELPPLRRVESRIGGLDRLAMMDASEIATARAHYFEEVDNCTTWRRDTLLVDKLPMNMNKVPLIHRLFPDARILLALRHPCDVVLSCYITTFRLNDAMANFLDLQTAAETYALSFGYFEQCRSILPIRVLSVRYEQLIADRATTLRPVFDYLGLEWRDEVLDHQATAAARGNIMTASYAQVTEPIYNRANGRWQRYRGYLEPIFPTLAPFVERLGYSL